MKRMLDRKKGVERRNDMRKTNKRSINNNIPA